ncbi:MAG: VCBS repeat-containing protein [Prolixibacteraceae bacterium]
MRILPTFLITILSFVFWGDIITADAKTSNTNRKLIFRHSTFSDFSKGKFSNSGQNLFVSKDGQIRYINWFDLNNDGYPEIVVPNDHNHYETTDAFIYYNTPGKGFRSLTQPLDEFIPGYQKLKWMEESLKSIQRLPALGGGRTLISDLNNDGYPEILFTNFVHGWPDNHFPVYIYWGSDKGYDFTRKSLVSTLSASGLAIADLDGNGYKDIVVANSGREYVARSNASIDYTGGSLKDYESKRELTSYIYWQQDYGFTEKNRSELPTRYALDANVNDFNGDGYPDIVFLQGGSPGSIRIFYGSSEGINAGKYDDYSALAPTFGSIPRKICVADLNGDNLPDIFVPSQGKSSEIFWNSKNGFDQKNITRIPTSNAIAAASKDLNNDGLMDLVIVNNLGKSFIYWGSMSSLQTGNRTELPTNGGTGVAIDDLNNDGFLDIVFSNSLKGDSFDTPSYIYWGSKDGYHPADREELMGYGAVDVAINDFNKDGLKDIFLMNRQSGKNAPQFSAETYNSTDLFVYWGNARSKYSAASMSTLPGVTGQASAVATDIDGNGYADLIYTTNTGRILNIFYGDSIGFRKENSKRFNIPFEGRSVLTADLNKDGFLDVIVGSRTSNDFVVFIGKRDGFEEMKKFGFGAPQFSAAIGDIDGDGNLDLVLGGHGFIKILYGDSKELFEKNKTQTIKTGMFTTNISLADFNQDGKLDIFGHHFSKADLLWENNLFSAIYWNRNGTFSSADKLELPSHGAHCGSVADINKDGNLDILIANYNSQYKRNLETFIYWGDSAGHYSQSRITSLPGYSPVANLVLDLNGDGFNDIVAFNHSESDQYAGLNPLGGIHATDSYIYWGSEKGWSIENRDPFPTVGPHSRLNAEPGDIMQRQPYEEYISAPIKIKAEKGKYNLKVENFHNFRQSITVYVKESPNLDDLYKMSWQEITISEQAKEYFMYDLKTNGGELYFQYKLRLNTGDTGNGPIVKSVELLNLP